MSIAWGGGYLKSDEEIDAMWKDEATPQKEKDYSAFWLVTFFLLSGVASSFHRLPCRIVGRWVHLESLMTKRSPFQRALDAAEKRLEKAKKERLDGQSKLALLDREIPELERMIIALRQRLVPPKLVHLSEVGTLEQPPISPAVSQAELAKYAMPQDLSGMGSIPAVKGPEVKELSEDELLRDDL